MQNIATLLLCIILLSSCQTQDLRTRPAETLPPTASPAENVPPKNPPATSSPTAKGAPALTPGLSPYPVSQIPGDEVFLDHGFFQLAYSPKSRLPRWVSYHLSAKNLREKHAKRRNRFYADPLLISLRLTPVQPDDFDGQTYDRGHMAPSDDFVWSQEANDATFVMTNMAPQARALNRGSWRRLELAVRKWACTEEELRVITGPVIAPQVTLRMASQIPIPTQFFKVVLDETPPRKAIAFLYKQEDSKALLKNQTVSLRDLEGLSGLKFFADLPANERIALEKGSNLGDWIESDCLSKALKRKRTR